MPCLPISISISFLPLVDPLPVPVPSSTPFVPLTRTRKSKYVAISTKEKKKPCSKGIENETQTTIRMNAAQNSQSSKKESNQAKAMLLHRPCLARPSTRFP
ncbi:hypothetical protein DL95DRAFT_50383 [Leptodontidium sp. 2 PMI_412]|nr:hypothetical protein DL95DRAFT_50383 [Leptodontidium sp. 2 PMI_412]